MSIRWVPGNPRLLISLVLVSLAPMLLGFISCEDFYIQSPTTQPGQETQGTTEQVADTELAYDRAKLMEFIRTYEDDLLVKDADGTPTAYKFALLLVFQNHIPAPDDDHDRATVAFDVWVNGLKINPWVNGQRVSRVVVPWAKQRVVAILNQDVRDTEQQLNATYGFNIDTANNVLLRRRHPYIVQLTNFVCKDDHIIQDITMVMAPINWFTTTYRPITKDVPEVVLGPHYTCPVVFAFALEKTRIQAIEVDREDMPDEPDEDEALQPEELKWPPVAQLDYLDEQEAVLAALGLDVFLAHSIDRDGDGLTLYFETNWSFTNPSDADTDGDGTTDGNEDFDGDGLTNLQEQTARTDPWNADTDGDGVDDGTDADPLDPSVS